MKLIKTESRLWGYVHLITSVFLQWTSTPVNQHNPLYSDVFEETALVSKRSGTIENPDKLKTRDFPDVDEAIRFTSNVDNENKCRDNAGSGTRKVEEVQ